MQIIFRLQICTSNWVVISPKYPTREDDMISISTMHIRRTEVWKRIWACARCSNFRTLLPSKALERFSTDGEYIAHRWMSVCASTTRGLISRPHTTPCMSWKSVTRNKLPLFTSIDLQQHVRPGSLYWEIIERKVIAP